MPEQIVEFVKKIAAARGEEFAAGALAVLDLVIPQSNPEQTEKEA